MDFGINTNSTWFKVAKAVVMPIPTAIEAVVDMVRSEPAKPAKPPIEKALENLPDANKTPADARKAAQTVWMSGDVSKDVISKGMLADFEQRAVNFEKAAQKDPKFKEQAASMRAQVEAARKELEAADLGAVKQLSANRKLEQDALKALTPAQQAQYKKLEATLDDNPQSHLALQLMLVEGKLTKGPTNKDGKNLMDALGQLNEAKLKEPMKNADLLAEACREIANPASIKQKSLNTCSAAAIQIMVATERPAEYARILTGLASESGGPVALQQAGKNLQRNEMSEYQDYTGRTTTSRLWQAAFMDFEAKALDANASYNNDTDTITWGDGSTTKDGIIGEGAALATKAVQDGDWFFVSQGNVMDRVMGGVLDDLKKKPPVKAKLELGAKYDAQGNPTETQTVTIEKFTPARKDAKGKEIPAKYTVKDDKTGKLVELTGKELGARLQAIPSKGFDREKVTDIVMKQVQDDVDRGQTAVVMLRWGDFNGNHTPKPGGGDAFNHFVTVTKIEGDRVHFTNSHGKAETMPLAEFKNKIDNATTHGQAVR